MVKEFRASHKKIFDPVHGLISIDESERELIDSPPFQRLHYIHQLGVVYLVFPGATHSRFEHSLGVMEISTRIYNKLCKNIRPDLFHIIPRKGSAEYLYWQKIVRLAALCHDLGHMPFSVFNGGSREEEHARFTISIIQSHYLQPVWEKIKAMTLFLSKGESLIDDIIKVALGEEILKKVEPKKNYNFTPWERVLSKIINGSFLGACKLDCLLRDSKATGVLYSLFDHHFLLETIRILPMEEGIECYEIGIDEDGVDSCEALALAYHFMQKKVYEYHTVLAYEFHLKRFLKTVYNDLFCCPIVGAFLNYTDASIINEINVAANDESHKGHLDAKKIIYRKDRFKAIGISDTISEKDLIKFKNKNNIADDQIAWEINVDRKKENFSFPVVKHYLKICPMKDCFSLLSKIPTPCCNWIYVAPEHEMLVMQYFGQ
jgi:uncharacterized protein